MTDWQRTAETTGRRELKFGMCVRWGCRIARIARIFENSSTRRRKRGFTRETNSTRTRSWAEASLFIFHWNFPLFESTFYKSIRNRFSCRSINDLIIDDNKLLDQMKPIQMVSPINPGRKVTMESIQHNYKFKPSTGRVINTNLSNAYRSVKP